MDIVLGVLDTLVLDRFYATVAPARNYVPVNGTSTAFSATTDYLKTIDLDPISEYFSLIPTEYAGLSALARDDWRRQLFSLWLVVWLFGVVLYFTVATLSYIFIFDKRTFDHPKFLKNQIRQEIKTTMWSLPWMSFFTVPLMFAEIRGYSKLYYHIDEQPMWYFFFQFPLFLTFTDCFIYLIHRGLHHPLVYKTLHKPHHKWIMPTPFASHAFHPLDGFAQSIPYHVFPFIFPLQKIAYLALFAFINLWTVMIHDGEYMADHPAINGAACHTVHHLYFNYNYGQFSTLWDRLGGSYRKPDDALFNKEEKMNTKEWNKQVKEMEKVVKEVETDDDREYLSKETKKTI